MSGTIRTYQKCPRCGAPFPSSKGGFPIICNPCMTQPTKYYIDVWWKGRNHQIYHDSAGKTIHTWNQAISVIGEIRSRIEAHRANRGFFDPQAYKKQSTTSFKAFWSRYLEGYSGATLEKVSTIGKHHLVYFNGFQMRDITAWNIDEWWRELQQKGLSARYCNDIQTWLRSFFKNAYELDIIEKIPRFPDILKYMKQEIKYLTLKEQVLILSKIPKHDKPIFEFLFLTGVRVNEACALQRSEIDIKHNIVWIKKTVKRDGTIGVVKNKKPRKIPYHIVKHCFNSDIIGIDFMFINKWGRRYTDDYLRDTAYKACDVVGIERMPLKNMTRHSWGMKMVQKGYDAWRIKEAYGHSTIKMSENYIAMQDDNIMEMYEGSDFQT